MRNGKTVLVLALACLLVLGLAGAALADEGKWTPPAASVDYRFWGAPAKFAEKMVLLDGSKTWSSGAVSVEFWCADEETADQFLYDGFSLSCPLAVDKETGMAYAVLPRIIGGEYSYGLGPAVKVCYHIGNGVYLGGDYLLVPLSDITQDKAVYVKPEKEPK
jgi:hypothetical protein